MQIRGTHLLFSFGLPLAVRLVFGAPGDGEPTDEDGGEAENEEEQEEEEAEVLVTTAWDCFCFSAAASIVSINETIVSPDFKVRQHSKDLPMWRFLFSLSRVFPALFETLRCCFLLFIAVTFVVFLCMKTIVRLYWFLRLYCCHYARTHSHTL